MRELAVAGAIAVGFTLVSYYATRGPTGGELGWYGWLNLVLGLAALLASAAMASRRVRGFGSPAARRVLLPRVAWILGVLAVAVVAEDLADRADWRLDWTADSRFELSPATRETCAQLAAPAQVAHFVESGDSRSRRTHFLLQSFEALHCFDVRERDFDDAHEELDWYGVTSPDSVVIQVGDYFELVERPTEGTLLEALLRLTRDPERTVYVAVGEGEGDLRDDGPSGYSGLREALAGEGYVLKSLVPLAAREIPDDADALLVIAPNRPIHAEARAPIERWIEGGGRLVALLEPGRESGLEPLLLDLGIEVGPGLVVDAHFADLEGTARGTGVLVSSYADHPITKGLASRHMTFFPGVRPVTAVRKPEPQDRLGPVVFSSPEAWTSLDVEAARRGVAPQHRDEPLERFSLVAAGRYPRDGHEGRVVVFGDAEFASNRWMRALYNTDLIVNAVHWACDRESAITLRPKMLTPDQAPLPPQTTLQMLYGVGLLVPEILLIIGAVVWVRRRSA
ncbi:MAG TPA: DUF4350 domain-containing protein [Myxococcota bacterium]|nr:DUF4350 domain-containing protein [Myxococcota bacterium]